MKFIIIIAFSILFSLTACLSLPTNERITLENGSVTFEIPAGFNKLSAEEISLVSNNDDAPSFTFANDNRTASVSCDIKGTGMPPGMPSEAELPDVLQEMAQTWDNMLPGIEWIKKEIIDINGRKFILFEIAANAKDKDFHNISMFAFYQEKMFMLNLNSSKNAFQDFESDFWRCIQTVVIK